MVAIKFMNKKILVTSALPYVNNVPHLGNLIGAVLSADVFARFQRSEGREVLYVCGADEHGTTTEAKAMAEGLTSKEICDKYYKLHKEIYDWFNIKFDIFGRTSAPNHVIRTQEIYNYLKESGFIIKKKVKQLYSKDSNMFLADRYVEGICPHCGYKKARGDQCDGCGNLLTPIELIEPKSKIDGSKPVIKETTHLFLDLKSLQKELEIWVGTQSEIGFWSNNAIKTTKSWFKEGLKPRAITRDLKWGVPVPDFKGKVFYVWFDAPIGYISITEQLLGDDWKKWWKAPNDVLLYQFMGKDNIPFHTILFPGTLIGTREEWSMLHHINSTEYLNYEDIKFSKSNGTGVFCDDVMNIGISPDIFRYYLLINRPENADTKFTWNEFKDRLNNELVANLGNFVNRTLTFINKEFGGYVSETPICEGNEEFWEKIKIEEQFVTDLLEEVKLKEALKKIMHISRLGNQFFQEQAPWKTIKEDKKSAEESLFILLNLVKDLAIMIEPYLPETSKNIFKQINIEEKRWDDLGAFSVKDHKISSPIILFKKLDSVDELKKRFSGKQNINNKNKKNNKKNYKENYKENNDEVNNKVKSENKMKNNNKNMIDNENDIKDSKIEKLDPAKLDLRVAKIIKIEKHPNAEKLYVEHLDMGELGERIIVSGLVPYYKPEELEGKNIIVVANLIPAKLRGIKSNGMLLAAEDDGGKVKVVFTDAKPGTRAVIEGIRMVDNPHHINIDQFFSLDYHVKNHDIYVEEKKLLINEKPVKSEVKEGLVR